MALPLVPFAAGLAVGSLFTYGLKDKTVREAVEHGYDWTAEQLAAGYEAMIGMFGAPITETPLEEVLESSVAAEEISAETMEASPEESEVVEEKAIPTKKRAGRTKRTKAKKTEQET
ncbi:MAG: hypothetical protein K1562_19955 [Candidatus Thiodiazotropha sp. (ex. Lucinisca nassula)]|nr:hypothetical protein [Candidatus Thiodiazotropha taylori]MBW9259861.1 hypothetical protein [Candidatus Thiodiazotropha sp. (ex. Lucinisca nassula)]